MQAASNWLVAVPRKTHRSTNPPTRSSPNCVQTVPLEDLTNAITEIRVDDFGTRVLFCQILVFRRTGKTHACIPAPGEPALASPDLPPPDKALQLACREEKEGGLVLSRYQPRKTTLARVCFSRVKPTMPLALTLQLHTYVRSNCTR